MTELYFWISCSQHSPGNVLGTARELVQENASRGDRWPVSGTDDIVTIGSPWLGVAPAFQLCSSSLACVSILSQRTRNPGPCRYTRREHSKGCGHPCRSSVDTPGYWDFEGSSERREDVSREGTEREGGAMPVTGNQKGELMGRGRGHKRGEGGSEQSAPTYVKLINNSGKCIFL